MALLSLKRSPRVTGAAVVLLLAFVAAGSWVGWKLWRRSQNYHRPPPVIAGADRPLLPTTGPAPPTPTETMHAEQAPGVRVETVLSDLQIVWDICFAPDGRMFFTERPGRVRVLRPGQSRPDTFAEVPTVLGGESGLMGIALHPQFPTEPYVYVMYTARKRGGGVNRVSRFTDDAGRGRDEQVLLDDIPSARNHDGGAIEFGPDGMLYVGTGDANVPYIAQDLSHPNGKVLRLAPDGKVPPDNPFPGSAVWAYGFRNISGLSFHPGTGELWAASHGPSSNLPGEPKYMDSVYVVQKGRNHGWPLHLGVSNDGQFVSPVLFWPDEAIPPGGSMFYAGGMFPKFKGNYLMTSLRSELMHRVDVGPGNSIRAIERWWPQKYGRLRAIAHGPDGAIYVGTSNRDGRTDRSYPGSDFIYRLVPDAK
ncbi:MAG TPA: PQQ-dependent sugar dehydrogenase [Tepidisphaeraceae bacterium]|nr:PQQ-dependent sugar dehydrogenase [Tepidisphaeraceae bacterium]